jgi:hypothetical protein
MIRLAISNQFNGLEPMIEGACADICAEAGANGRPSNLQLLHVPWAHSRK